MKGKIRSLGILAAIFFTSVTLAKVNLPDALNSREEQIQYLLYLQSEIPTLFEQGAEYDVNFFDLIRDQNRLVEVLQSNREYLQLSVQRPPRAELTIGFAEKAKATNQIFQIDQFSRVTADVGLTVDENFHSLWNALLPHLVEAQHLSGLMTGIMGAYPPELKGKGFKLKTHAEKLNFLRENPLNDSALAGKFRFDRFGLGPANSNWKGLLDLAGTWTRTELEIGHAVATFCQRQNNPSACAELLTQEDIWLKSIADEISLTPNQQSALGKIRQSLLAQYSVKQSGGEGKVEITTALRLVEAPPNIGIFRGLVGGDCSTNTSFPYVYMPHERTYFLYSANGTVLGYLQGTVVRDQRGTSQLYIHSIAGASISHRNINLALHALAQKAKDLGYESVLIPDRHIIHRNINYVAIHEVLYPMIGRSPIAIVYPDNELRKMVGNGQLGFRNTVASTYDVQEGNPQGFPVLLDQKLLEEIQVEIKPSQLVGEVNTKRALTRADSVLAALDLLAGLQSKTARGALKQQIADVRAGVGHAGTMNFAFRRAAATEVLRPWGLILDGNGGLPVHDQLNNVENLPLAEYYARLSATFKEVGIELTDKLIDGRPYLFNEGHLSAPDALTTKDDVLRKRTVRSVINMIKRWPRPDIALRSIHMAPGLFQGSNQFQKLVLQLARGDSADLKKLIQIEAHGYEFSKVERVEVIEVIRAKLNQPTLTEVYRSDLHSLLRVLERGFSCEDAMRRAS